MNPKQISITPLILAGGKGTRLQPLLPDRPKVLAEIGGRPFITHLLDQLIQAGFPSAIICTGYLGEQISKVLGAQYRNLQLVYSHESTPRGTAGAVRLALPLIGSEAVLVMNGDSYTQVDLKAFAYRHLLRRADASLVLVPSTETKRFGQVEISLDQRILHFGEKETDLHSEWINAGIYCFSRRLIGQIPADRPSSLETEMFPQWMQKEMFGYPVMDTLFVDIGTPESYQKARQAFEMAPR